MRPHRCSPRPGGPWPTTWVPNIAGSHRRFHHRSLRPDRRFALRKSAILRAPFRRVRLQRQSRNLPPAPKDAAERLFAQAGMKLLRHENVAASLPRRRILIFSAVDLPNASAPPEVHRLQMLPDLANPDSPGYAQYFCSPTHSEHLQIAPRSWALSYLYRRAHPRRFKFKSKSSITA